MASCEQWIDEIRPGRRTPFRITDELIRLLSAVNPVRPEPHRAIGPAERNKTLSRR
jgi:hypothetical protein